MKLLKNKKEYVTIIEKIKKQMNDVRYGRINNDVSCVVGSPRICG